MDIVKTVAEELKIKESQLAAALELLDAGNTIPFVARYRKEVTGGLDDTKLRNLWERVSYLRSLEERRREVRDLIDAQGKLTPEIVTALERATILAEIEDIYRPFRPKRKTRASVARERGLEPLAALLMEQRTSYDMPIEKIAAQYIDDEKGVADAEAALAGACDIIAEDISDNAEYRRVLRDMTRERGIITVKKNETKSKDKDKDKDKDKKEESTGANTNASATASDIGIKNKDTAEVYAMYYDYSESVARIASHRVLAINRGEREEALKVSLSLDKEAALSFLYSQIISQNDSPARKYITAAIEDSYTRLIAPSIEREIRAELTEAAEEGAIKVFAENLRHLLMQPPIKGKVVMGYDPGYRTGCKLAVVDEVGRVLDTAVIYPTKPHERIEEAKKIVLSLIKKYNVNIIAIGNGTASRESERFIAGVLREIPEFGCKYVIVSEAGASVYSASKAGAEEFPDFDVTQRSAVSIARRLQDPLAELVKIEPRSIGVGQYQHDMKPARLDAALSGVVEACVNAVGVDVNTASKQLLSYVAGLNGTAAKNIVKYREEHGAFPSRAALLSVPHVGEKTFVQCAGFLRVPDGTEALDATGVHPESYGVARLLLKRYGYTEDDVRSGGAAGLRQKIEAEGVAKVCEELGVGAPTLNDIVTELEKPGRDVRDAVPPPILREDVLEITDLEPGMSLMGTVRNVTDFGAFVDIGVHQDGLLHISEISDKFIRHPSEVLAVGDIITVMVKSIDEKRGRISLTCKGIKT
mgnify:CR=1 FL=1